MVDKSLVLRKLSDAEIVVGILKKSLPDFDAFKKAVVKFLEAEG
jgi:hypothetical protein